VIRFDFQLCGAGWAEVTISDSMVTLVHGAGDATDPLGDLGDALVRLATGGDRAEVLFLEDDTEHRWILERAGHDGLHLDVVRADGCTELDPGRPTRLVFRATGSLSRLAQDYSNCLSGIRRTHGIAGYEALWATHRFPRRSLDALQRRFGSLR